MISQDWNITSLEDLLFADQKHHFRDIVFVKEDPGPKHHSEIGSGILYDKFQETDRKSKSMISMYSSNYGSTPLLCLPLTLLSFEGGNTAGTMGEEGLSPLCLSKTCISMMNLCTKGCTFVRSARKAATLLLYLWFCPGMNIDSFMDFDCSSWIFIDEYLKPQIIKIQKFINISVEQAEKYLVADAEES